MKKLFFYLILLGTFFNSNFFNKLGLAHEVNYQVKEFQGVCVSFFFGNEEPMNYADVEVYSPTEKIVFQKGKTDKNGIFCFMPDKEGTWKLVARGETEHGFHGTEVEVKIGKEMGVEGFKKPLIARYTKFFVALGVVGWLLGLTGIFLYLKNLKKTNNKQ